MSDERDKEKMTPAQRAYIRQRLIEKNLTLLHATDRTPNPTTSIDFVTDVSKRSGGRNYHSEAPKKP